MADNLFQFSGWYTGKNTYRYCLIDYLCYKTATSQNVKHKLRIFLFYRKVIFHFQDIQVFVFLTIPWFNTSVASWWVLVHETGYIIEYIFWAIWWTGTKFQVLLNLASSSSSITSYVKITVLHFLKRWIRDN